MRSHIDKQRRREIFENFRVGPNSAVYDEHGNVIMDPKEKNKQILFKVLKIAVPIIVVLLILSGIIYLPQFFVSDQKPNELVFETNKKQYEALQSYLKEKPDADFDNDGLINYEEIRFGSNPFSSDTDRDGICDSIDKNKCTKDNAIYNSLVAQGDNMDDPYEINGIILWPDSKDAWALGAVIPVETGYRFTNYKGWAKFPTGKYAYQYIDGKHTLLKHKESANAWYIDKDCTVVLVDEKPENTHLISFFGHSTYMRGGFGSFLAAVLPNRGWISGETMWLEDTFVDTRTNVYAKYQRVEISNLPDSRFATYSESLSDLAEVYAFIDKGKCVMASVMSEKHGEAIVEIYGYTADGDLIAADPQVKTTAGTLEIKVCCSRALDENGQIKERSWFEFKGCGFDSDNGDLIGFYSVVGGDT